ncbi:MAG TPA: lipase maturation factor family protein [Verrucomicrobiae bacterium]|nr:lipase maturation factor family protein [Verrucomicrobiae bacterium]
MKCGIRVATPPSKPLMVFDGDCNFCTLWIRRWQQMTGDRVDYLPAQDPSIAAQFPEIPREQFDTAVQLIETDGAVYSGAEAVFRALAHSPKCQWPLRTYRNSSALADLTEWAYRLVAKNRSLFSRLTRWFWGRHVERPTHLLTRWVFLRALGVIYLIAFVSLWMQIGGLIGHNGILPTDQFMTAVRQQCDAHGIGIERYHLLPTLCWLDASDSALNFQCAAGSVLAALLIAGIAPVPCLVLLWLFYLSLATVGRDFLGFQWDNLLLETGFLAIFFAPLQLLPRVAATPSSPIVRPISSFRLLWQRGVALTFGDGGVAATPPPSRLVLWLLRLLLFKLMFSSGCVKLLSGDPNWRNLTALTFHYQTQPLPTWIGWYANQLPLCFQKFSCAAMFAIELGAPWLIFAPRRIRFLGGAAIASLQVLILLTGNYTFFNLLTLALCLLLLDDFVCLKFTSAKFRAAFVPVTRHPSTVARTHWPHFITVPLAVVVTILYVFQVSLTLGTRPAWLFPVAVADAWLQPFRTFSGYGLFAVMTTDRREIIVEGSNDGVNWLPYEFKYKPGDVDRRPAFVAPHQPRLDWQMWFAALGDARQNPWFVNFCERLLRGSPDVLSLLAKNPFPGHPPHYIRAEFYDYRFTNFAERRATGLRRAEAASSTQAGAWWQRELIGEYLPPISLQE